MVLTNVHRMRYVFVRVTKHGHFEAIVHPFRRRLGRFQRLQVIIVASSAHGQKPQTYNYDFGQHLNVEANRIETSDCVHCGVQLLVVLCIIIYYYYYYRAPSRS